MAPQSQSSHALEHGMEPGRAEFKGVKDVDEIGGEAEPHSDAVPVRPATLRDPLSIFCGVHPAHPSSRIPH